MFFNQKQTQTNHVQIYTGPYEREEMAGTEITKQSYLPDISVWKTNLLVSLDLEGKISSYVIELKVKNDHRSKFSYLSNWKEEA